MKNYNNFLPLKFRIILWSFWPFSKIQLRFTRAVSLLLIFTSLLGFTQVFAQEQVRVSLQVRVNGKVIFDQNNISVPNGCSLNNGQFVSGVVVICAINAATISYSVVGDTNSEGLFLETLLGVTGKEGVCVSPNCWTYRVNGNFADSGVDSFILNNGNSIVFNFGSELVAPSSSVVTPVVQSTSVLPVAATPQVTVNQKVVASPQPRVAQTIVESVQSQIPTQTIKPPAQAQTHQLATSTTDGCFIKFAWAQYTGKPGIFYGSWDRSYYIFVFPLGQTRDQAVWKGEVNGFEAKAGGLTPGTSYIGEIFLHGAFLAGERPYWASLGAISCTNPPEVQNSTSKKPAVLGTGINPNIKNLPSSQTSVITGSQALNQNSNTITQVLSTPQKIQDSSVERALNYLRTQQKPTGLIENLTVSNWAALAFAAAGGVNEKLLSAVTSDLALEKATDVERSILVAVASGKDPRNFSGVNLVSKLEGFVNNRQIGDQTSISDDSFGILAFIAAGQPSDVKDSLNFLIKNQNTDGGWGFNKNNSSDVDSTAAVIQALIGAKNFGLTVENDTIQKAKTFLKNNQNSDGGFPFNKSGNNKESNAASSSWAIQALVSLGEDSSRAENFLKSLQTSSGGFKTSLNGSVSNLATAYAVIALLRKPFPIKSGSVLGASLTSLPNTGFELNILTIIFFFVFISGVSLFVYSEKFSLKKKQVFQSNDYYGRIFDQVGG